MRNVHDYRWALMFRAVCEDICRWLPRHRPWEPHVRAARRQFFGQEEPVSVHYHRESGAPDALNRRLLSWFMFDGSVDAPERPALLVAKQIYTGKPLAIVTEALRSPRYVYGEVTAINRPQETVWIDANGSLYAVVLPELAAQPVLPEKLAFAGYLVPTGSELWAPSPGWLAFKPNGYAYDGGGAIWLERALQGRLSPPDAFIPFDSRTEVAFEEAVRQMTEAAVRASANGLVLSETAWGQLVAEHMIDGRLSAFLEDMVRRLPNPSPTPGEQEEWLRLASQIWCAVPQLDRDGKTAFQLYREHSV